MASATAQFLSYAILVTVKFKFSAVKSIAEEFLKSTVDAVVEEITVAFVKTPRSVAVCNVVDDTEDGI